MDLNKLIYCYQRKIGAYDKQQWEKTIEQKIFGGFTHVPMRTAKLKTELIDVDLVRGSSFPKAKPKHGLFTVAYLALQRLLFLPLNWKWWIQQTSIHIFILFLLLYCLQLINITLYYYHTSTEQESDVIATSEVFIPIIIMLILCFIHSHIVSTNSGPSPIKSQGRQRVIRRSRHDRSRFGKSRVRRTREDSKSSQDTPSEKTNTLSGEIISSVRFAKKVIIKNCLSTTCTQKFLPVSNASVKKKVESTLSSNKSTINDASSASSEVARGEENAPPVHQDDDGFESLNGNVSSDNDKFISNANSDVLNTEEDIGMDVDEDNEECSLLCSRNEVLPLIKSSDHHQKEHNSLENIGESSYKVGEAADVSNVIGSRGSIIKKPCESEEEGECEEAVTNHLTEAMTSATEWMGVTTNSDECSYSSELKDSDLQSENEYNYNEFVEQPFLGEFELPPSILLGSSYAPSDRVSCTIWTRREIKKAELSVLDISSAIIARVESMPEGLNYFYGGLMLGFVLSLVPSLRRFSDRIGIDSSHNTTGSLITTDFNQINYESYIVIICNVLDITLGSTIWERLMIAISAFERLALSCLLFFLLAVAERSYKQRLLYAKLFSHLTSSRRARKSDLPHFRLNKVRNIKTWLSIRSYLKRRGPQRSVDIIVSATFIVTLLLLSFVCLELIKDLESLHCRYNIEALFWSFSLGIFILRFMTLGTKINKKYRNLSVLITEQINLYLQIEQKPHKKDELMVANSVLKLAADLIKELESPFKISGLSANPYLYTITKVVLLSALSGVLSELLGFKLKLHKIKIK
ncbi:protein phtf [Prorops nasuta]|uniref:protein phtf n=1 Tax=Prorops nasuta TaxID=863751 RepID=UPI0034CEB06F